MRHQTVKPSAAAADAARMACAVTYVFNHIFRHLFITQRFRFSIVTGTGDT
jgi:hypothetical protein